MLQPIELPRDFDAIPLPSSIADKLAVMRSRIETFQDCWEQHHAAQFVAADYELVYRALRWISETQWVLGKRFLEWGCGFATVSCLADTLGWNAHAVEAHPGLIAQARTTVQGWPAKVALCEGNFLPAGADSLAGDPTLPSLGHEGTCAYDHWETDLDDFALVYSYPWPGEDDFHEQVFERFAAPGGLLLMFIGPNELRLCRKASEFFPPIGLDFLKSF